MSDENAAGAPPAEVTILPNPPSIQEAEAAALVNEPALAEPKEHEKQAKDKPEAEKPEGEEEKKVEAKDEDGEQETETKKKVPGSQRYKRALARLEGDYEAILRENADLRARAAPKDNPQGKPGIDRAPTEADYPNDYVRFDRELLKWETKQAVREELTAAQQQSAEARRNAAQRDVERESIEAYEEYADKVRERIPDFDKVVRSAKDVVVKEPVIRELLASDKSALLQYHLAQNPDVVRELNAMTPIELAREIGRLEARVHLPKPKTATEAPSPLKNPAGGAAPAFNPRTASMDEYVKARQSGWTGKG